MLFQHFKNRKQCVFRVNEKSDHFLTVHIHSVSHTPQDAEDGNETGNDHPGHQATMIINTDQQNEEMTVEGAQSEQSSPPEDVPSDGDTPSSPKSTPSGKSKVKKKSSHKLKKKNSTKHIKSKTVGVPPKSGKSDKSKSDKSEKSTKTKGSKHRKTNTTAPSESESLSPKPKSPKKKGKHTKSKTTMTPESSKKMKKKKSFKKAPESPRKSKAKKKSHKVKVTKPEETVVLTNVTKSLADIPSATEVESPEDLHPLGDNPSHDPSVPTLNNSSTVTIKDVPSEPVSSPVGSPSIISRGLSNESNGSHLEINMNNPSSMTSLSVSTIHSPPHSRKSTPSRSSLMGNSRPLHEEEQFLWEQLCKTEAMVKAVGDFYEGRVNAFDKMRKSMQQLHDEILNDPDALKPVEMSYYKDGTGMLTSVRPPSRSGKGTETQNGNGGNGMNGMQFNNHRNRNQGDLSNYHILDGQNQYQHVLWIFACPIGEERQALDLETRRAIQAADERAFERFVVQKKLYKEEWARLNLFNRRYLKRTPFELNVISYFLTWQAKLVQIYSGNLAVPRAMNASYYEEANQFHITISNLLSLDLSLNADLPTQHVQLEEPNHLQRDSTAPGIEPYSDDDDIVDVDNSPKDTKDTKDETQNGDEDKNEKDKLGDELNGEEDDTISPLPVAPGANAVNAQSFQFLPHQIKQDIYYKPSFGDNELKGVGFLGPILSSQYSMLTSLELTNCQLTDDDLHHMVLAWRTRVDHSPLQSLSLAENPLHDTYMDELFDVLANYLGNVMCLMLQDTQITDETALSIFNFYKLSPIAFCGEKLEFEVFNFFQFPIDSNSFSVINDIDNIR